jgi:hypothetical protein
MSAEAAPSLQGWNMPIAFAFDHHDLSRMRRADTLPVGATTFRGSSAGCGEQLARLTSVLRQPEDQRERVCHTPRAVREPACTTSESAQAVAPAGTPIIASIGCQALH